MESLAQALLEDFDDAGFCETLLAILHNPTQRGDLALLYDEWILARLRQVKQQAPAVFYGQFVATLRREFPRQVYPPDLMAAMLSVTTQIHADQGDVAPDAWRSEIEEVFQHGLPQGVHPGWESLEPHYRPLRGHITVITGIASHFKTSFMHHMAINLARRQGWNFGLFSPEHHPLGSLGNMLVETYMGQPSTALSEEEREHALTWITDRFHIIRPPGETAPNLPWLLAVARMQKERYGLDGLIIDPWNYVDHTFDRREETETQYISRCLSMNKRFAEAQNVHVWVLAHPTKPMNGKATSGLYKDKYPPPTPYDIAGGAHWYNKNDNCLCCWRDAQEDSPVVEIHVQKVKHRIQCGRPGKVYLRFDGRRFHDMETAPATHWNERD